MTSTSVMACLRKDGAACQFREFAEALIEFEGHEYCPMHLPLASPKKLVFGEFKKRVDRLFELGNRDFACIAIVGAEQAAIYDNVREGDYRNCDVGANVHLYHGGAANWSHSTFHGIVIISPSQTFECRNAIFESAAEFHCNGSNGIVDLTKSVFQDRCRFSSLHSLSSLRLDYCTFSRAPSIDSTSHIPQETTCAGAKFNSTRGEDEGNYRTIRNYCNDNRARELEGTFYALEKRCHRRRLSWIRAGIPRAISWLYDATAEYGQSYGRALLWLFGLQLVFGFGYEAASGRLRIPGPIDGNIVGFTFAQVVKPFELFSNRGVSESSVFEIVPLCSREWWMFGTAIHSVASLVLATLFVLALRWRFRRE
jgi:hypothetical protein